MWTWNAGRPPSRFPGLAACGGFRWSCYPVLPSLVPRWLL
jgi:hypothetical protein